MFEEVPRERRGVARLLARPVVLGPFVVGTGVLVAALGGSVAVATAATVITASAISSPDLPARPGHAVLPTSSPHTPVATRQATPHRVLRAPSAAPRPSASPSGGALARQFRVPSTPSADSVQTPSRTQPAAPVAGTDQPATPSADPLRSALASPSEDGPLGNALVYFTGYDQARGRIAYQFASRQSGAPGHPGFYRVSGPARFTATLASSLTITSGGTLCPPAGSSCSPDQLLNAAQSGFFAEVAIDAAGALRSVVEVAGKPATAKSAPSTSPSLDSSPLTSQAIQPTPAGSTSVAPETSSAAS